LGTFNTVPAPGQRIIPINNYTGPGQFSFNLRISKTFGFGTKKEVAASGATSGRNGLGGFGRGIGGGPGGGGRGGGGRSSAGAANNGQRYSLTFGVNARDVFNVVNPSTPAGNLGSPKFDTSNSLATGAFGNGSAVRLIQLQAQFNF
jgi:hypothetical protein